MDWLYVLMPISGCTVFWPGLIILGLGVGIIGGFFGMGGAWMVTPGLNILGFPMAFAIGTDVSHMAGKSLISTFRHAKFGNVDYKLGLTMLIGTVIGMEIGAQIVMYLERLGNVDKIVRWLYVVLLLLLSWLVFGDLAKRKRMEREAAAKGEKLDDNAQGVDWASKLQRIKIPPMIHYHDAGILGIGGGLIRMPALVYLIGCPTHIAVGTDLFEVAISGLYGAATYTMKGRTELVAALIMLIGAAIGAQIGAVATKYIRGYGIRAAFGCAVVGCLCSVVLKLIQPYFPAYASIINGIATVVVLGFVFVISTYIAVRMFAGVKNELAEKKRAAQN